MDGAEQAAVEQAFLDYRTAAVAKRREDAAEVAASRTLDHYESIRKRALTMPEAELRKTPGNDHGLRLVAAQRCSASR